MIQEITNNNMGAANEKPLAIVDFSATWCGPCKMLAPLLEELSEEMADQASFFSVDIDANQLLAGGYGITGVPTLLAIKEGNVVGQSVGFLPKAQVKAWIESYL